MSAGVARRGKGAALASWGLDGRNPDSPMTPSGQFRIGSVTKTFTSALVLDLIDQGDLDLDDTIERWVPTYPHAAQISVRSLLMHTAGTADMISDAFSDYTELLLADLSRRFTPRETLALMSALPAHGAPDELYRYSNTDYLLLGYILERVSGLSFAELLRSRFTTRLHLDRTTYDTALPDDLKHGWFDFESLTTADAPPTRNLDVRDFPNDALITTTFAAGGMTSSLADLLSWGAALYLGAALSPSMRALLLASPSVEDPATGRWHGLGVVAYGTRSADGSWPAYGHAGNIVGSSAFVASFPRSRTTVAIHANVQHVTTEQLVDLAFVLAEIEPSDTRS